MIEFNDGDIIYTKDIKGNIIYKPRKIKKIMIINGGNLREGLYNEVFGILDDNKEYRLSFENKNYNVYNVYAEKVNKNKTCNDIFIKFMLMYIIRL